VSIRKNLAAFCFFHKVFLEGLKAVTGTQIDSYLNAYQIKPQNQMFFYLRNNFQPLLLLLNAIAEKFKNIDFKDESKILLQYHYAEDHRLHFRM
jgi:hypothetical protein